MNPDLRTIADPDCVTDALESAGLRSVEAPPLTLERAWPIWGGGLCALFGAGVDLEQSWGLVTAHRGLPRAVRSALGSGRAVLLPALRAFAFPFPEDPRLPRLAEMTRPRRFHSRLEAWLPGSPRVTARAYKPLYRALVEYRYGEAPEAALFVKMQTRYGAETTRRVHRAIRRAGTAETLELAHPIGFVDTWRANVWRGIAGGSLRSRLRRHDAAEALRAAARDLATLHSMPVELETRHDRERELDTVDSWIGAAAASFPSWHRELAALRRHLAAALGSLGAERPVTAHRDFHDDQVLFDGRRTVLLDLDTVSRAEAELDLGNFLAHLELQEVPEALAGDFLDAYHRSSPAPPAPGVVNWYLAASLLRLACVYAFRPGAAARLPTLLERAARSITRLQTEKEVSVR